jgi:hypothetical protein
MSQRSTVTTHDDDGERERERERRRSSRPRLRSRERPEFLILPEFLAGTFTDDLSRPALSESGTSSSRSDAVGASSSGGSLDDEDVGRLPLALASFEVDSWSRLDDEELGCDELSLRPVDECVPDLSLSEPEG